MPESGFVMITITLQTTSFCLLQYAWRATQVQVLGYYSHEPTHDVAPRAVTMAVATDAMICTMNLMVSFLLIMFNV